jgi:hypothetical protein
MRRVGAVRRRTAFVRVAVALLLTV